MRVKIGATSRKQKRFVEIDVSRIIMHEKFENAPSYNNDIGMLKLARPFPDKGKHQRSNYSAIKPFKNYDNKCNDLP